MQHPYSEKPPLAIKEFVSQSSAFFSPQMGIDN